MYMLGFVRVARQRHMGKQPTFQPETAINGNGCLDQTRLSRDANI